jgi:CRP/FNR family cyclic AMP-dependent transcriptional regulator
MAKSRIKILQSMPVFGGLSADTLQILLDLATVVPVEQGAFFFRERDRGHSMFVLEQGQVAVLKTWEGQDVLLGHLNAGDCFGEMALIDFCPRSASVRAEEPCQALEIPGSSLRKVYQQDIDQFVMIHMNMGREVSRRLREADQKLFEVQIARPEQDEECGPYAV